MIQDRELALEFNEETLAMIEDLSKKSGQSQEQVVEKIIQEHLMNQVSFIEKKATETGKTIHEVLNQQFVDILEFLLKRENS